MILFECPSMIGPLDTATLARCRIIPFFWAGKVRFLDFGANFFANGQVGPELWFVVECMPSSVFF